MQKLLTAPDENGYSVTENQAMLLTAALDGGNDRTRLDIIDGGSRIVTLQWSGSFTRYKTVRDFITENLGLNCEPFLMDLKISSSIYLEYICTLVPDSVKFTNTEGISFYITATFEVNARDDEILTFPGEESICVCDLGGIVPLPLGSRDNTIAHGEVIYTVTPATGSVEGGCSSTGQWYLNGLSDPPLFETVCDAINERVQNYFNSFTHLPNTPTDLRAVRNCVVDVNWDSSVSVTITCSVERYYGYPGDGASLGWFSASTTFNFSRL